MLYADGGSSSNLNAIVSKLPLRSSIFSKYIYTTLDASNALLIVFFSYSTPLFLS